MLTLGSGSIREIRDVGFLIDLEDYAVKRIRATAFYDHLRKELEKREAGELNIEGTVFRKDSLYLFHRGNISGKNLVISILWKEFIEYAETQRAFSLQIYQVELPVSSGFYAGFSGACRFQIPMIFYSQHR